MSASILAEELEVLVSIYPTELFIRSDKQIQIVVEPDDAVEGADDLKLMLTVDYNEGYPDALPELSLEAVEGEARDDEIASLLDGLRTVGEENLGMAMTFTLLSHLQEHLSAVVNARVEEKKKAELQKEMLELEAEAARTRGTPVTVESFRAWKIKFDDETTLKKARDNEEKMKGMTPKEREEFKRLATRLTGRQLFERSKNLEDETLLEEGTVSVDISQYQRTRGEEGEETEHIRFSDSD